MTKHPCSCLLVVPWVQVLGGLWPGARVVDTANSAQCGWIGTVIRVHPPKEGKVSTGLRIVWEVPVAEEGVARWSMTSITGGTGLILGSESELEGLAGNVAVLVRRISAELGVHSSPFWIPHLVRKVVWQGMKHGYWELGGLAINDPDARICFGDIKVPGVGFVKSRPELLRLLSVHLTVVPEDLQWILDVSEKLAREQKA